jgi:uncharacterized protein (TIGR00369 family)
VITGGTLAILADIALGCSVETKLPPATPYTTAELSLSFVQPARPTGAVLEAGGQSIHVGRSVALSEAFLIDEVSGRLIAHGTSRCVVLPPIADAPPPGDQAVEPAAGSGAGEPPDPYLRPVSGEVIPEALWAELGGAEVLRRQLAGELPAPPIKHLTGLEPIEAGEGTAAMRLPCTPWLTSPLRTVQGGVIAMLADASMLSAVQTTVDPGVAFAGLDLKVNYLRPVFGDGRDLVARAEVVNRGRTLAIARAEVVNDDGKPVALATGSSIYLPGRPASLGDVELSEG